MSYIRNIATVFSGNIIAQAIPLILGPIITRLFTPEEVAVYGAYITIGSMFAVIACLRFELAIMLPKTNEEALEIVRRNVRLAFTVALISVLLSILFKDQMIEYTENKEVVYFLWAVPLMVFFTGVYQSFYNYTTRIKSYKKVTSSRVVQSTGVNGFAIVLNYLKTGPFGLVSGHVLGLFASTAILFKKEYIVGKVASLKELFKNYRDFPLVNGPHAFTDILFQRFGIMYLLIDFYGLEIYGFYELSNRYLKGPLRLITSSVAQVFFQQTAEEKSNDQSSMKTLIKTSFISLGIGVPMLVVLLFFGEDLFALVFGESWAMAGVVASIMVWSLFTNFLSSPISTIPILFNKQKQAFVFGLLGQLIPLVISYGYMKGLFLSDFDFYDGDSKLNTLLIFSVSSSVYYLLMWLWYLKIARKS